MGSFNSHPNKLETSSTRKLQTSQQALLESPIVKSDQSSTENIDSSPKLLASVGTSFTAEPFP